MTEKFKNFLFEANKLDPVSLTTNVMSAVSKSVNDWEQKNLGRLKEWEYDGQKDEFYLSLANDMLDYFNGMKKAAERNLKKKR